MSQQLKGLIMSVPSVRPHNWSTLQGQHKATALFKALPGDVPDAGIGVINKWLDKACRLRAVGQREVITGIAPDACIIMPCQFTQLADDRSEYVSVF